MKVKVRYQKPCEEPVTTELDLHKNAKGYNVKIEGKYYFPAPTNPVIQNLEKYEHQELWVVVKEDKYNWGAIAFAVPDYFIKPDFENKSVIVEKEIPLNQIDNVDEPFKWDYVEIGKCSNVDDTDKFIDKLESEGCPEQLIKAALNEFYAMDKNLQI